MSIAAAQTERLIAPILAAPAKETAAQAIAAHKLGEAKDAARSLAANRFKPQDSAKQQARAKVQSLVERVRILKKLYAGNPREMAHALAQVLKELKAAVRVFAQATGEEFGMAGDVVGAAAGGGQAAPEAKTDGEGQAGSGEAAPDDAAPPAEVAPGDPGEAKDADLKPATAASETTGVSAYAAATQEVREGIGRDAVDFAKSVRGLAKDVTDLLDAARAQAKAARRNRETDKAFEEADKAMHELHRELDAVERDVSQQAPTVGIKLSVAA